MNKSSITLSLLFLVFLTIFFPSFNYSQVSGSKPDEGSNVYDVVDPKTLEIDADFYMEKYTRGSSNSIKKLQVNVQSDLKYFNAPNLTFRYGLVKNLELQVITGYTGILTNGTATIKTPKNRIISATKNTTGLSSLGLGFKAGLLSNKKARPSIAFTGIMNLPNIGNPAFTPNTVGTDLTLSFYNSLSEDFDLEYIFGTTWSGYKEDKSNSYNYGISPGYSFSDYTGLYLDFTGLLENGASSDNRVDLDFSAYLNDYITLDVYAGTSFNVKKFYFIGSTFTATIPL
jgi:hypothetical protein